MNVLAALAIAAMMPLSPASPTDPSDTQCYRGAIYCPPPYYGSGESPTCQYILGRWVTPFGVPCP